MPIPNDAFMRGELNTIIGPDNDLSPVQRHAITCTNSAL